VVGVLVRRAGVGLIFIHNVKNSDFYYLILTLGGIYAKNHPRNQINSRDRYRPGAFPLRRELRRPQEDEVDDTV
jgi:hypothetical protein